MGRGLSPEQRWILQHLSLDREGSPLHPASRYEQMAFERSAEDERRLNVEAASLSRTLRRLKQRGLIEKFSHYFKEAESWGYLWRLTHAGKESVKELKG